MIYPVLVYKERNDLTLYGFENERNLKHTSRELLNQGVFEDLFLVDSIGSIYKIENVIEEGWANIFWGLSLFRKGRQILITFDSILIKQESLEEIRSFVLERLSSQRENDLNVELADEVKKATSISQIINCFI